MTRKAWLPAVAVVAAIVIGVAVAFRPSGHTDPVAQFTPDPGPPTATEPAFTPSPSATPPPTRIPHTLHYISNTGPRIGPVAALGFNLFDLGPDKSVIDSLGPGQRALVWLGNLDNTSCTPGYSWGEFTAAVRRLAHDPKVFGYFLSDEPHPSVCPDAVSDIRQRADFIRDQDPQQKSFIVVLDASRICGASMGCEYRLVNPSTTHVDLFGVDPFPCRVQGGCDMNRIDLDVHRAVEGGIPIEQIVPVLQTFGQACSTNKIDFYQEPSADQLEQLLARWAVLVPHPAFDFTYTWRSGGPACPALDVSSGDSHPDLQAVMRDHNRG